MSELSNEARVLLSHLGEADGPSPSQTARMKRNLGIALGAAGGLAVAGGATGVAKASAGLATSGVVAGKASGTSLASLISIFALGAAAGVGVSTTTLAVRYYASPPASSAVTNPRAETAPAVWPSAIGAPPPPEVAPSPTEAAPADSVAPVRSPGALPSAAVDMRPAPVEPTLGPEVELVIAAKRELSQGRPAQALALVDRLGVEFPNGVLREERLLLRVLSLCALGHVDAARRQAKDFAALAPRSPLLPRLEQSCGGAPR